MSDMKRGLVIVYTGDGKGKTTAALGCGIRATGHGNRVMMIQFIKGDWPIEWGEKKYLEFVENANAPGLFPDFKIKQMGQGFYGIMGDKKDPEVHKKAADQAMQLCEQFVKENACNLLIMDEINCAVHDGLVSEHRVISLIEDKPEEMSIILTGRNATKKIINRADLVTEMKEVKHPWKTKKWPAKKGIDF